MARLDGYDGAGRQLPVGCCFELGKPGTTWAAGQSRALSYLPAL